jgi:trans-aconitate methyltransferase
MSTYEFDGEKYKRASGHQKEWGEKLIEELDLRGNEHILDLGCGHGVLTARLAALVPDGRVVGIDASRGMIGVARQKHVSNLDFVLMDINDMCFFESFDIVFSNATLHWVRDHMRLLFNVHSVLRTTGVARFSFGGDGNCVNFIRIVREAMKLDQYRRYFRGFEWPWYMPSVEEYTALAERTLFSAVHVWSENADRFFLDAESLISWIEQPSIVPFVSSMAERDKIGFTKFVENRMVEETHQEDGTYFETFRRLHLLAVK